MEKKWWHESVVYQVYPRSFKDTNGDGIGDLRGIIEQLDYLKNLGINVIWLSPIYKSPNDDNGYDISDYYGIHEDYGTMEDFDELVEEANKRGIKLLMDLVVNHTSDEHAWFKEARKSKDNPYRDFYVWREGTNGNVPNGLTSVFSGSAWELDPQTNEYYLHLFSKRQPDLNWENPKVHEEVYKLMNFWLQRGIGGFRMDVIDLIGKLPDQEITVNGPKLHTYLKEMHEATFGHYDVLTVGETNAVTPELAKIYTNPENKELSMVFQFEHIALDQQEGKEKWDLKPLDLRNLKRVMSKWQTELEDIGWNSLFWNNHDQPRIVSRWGNDTTYRVESAKMFGTLLHMMKGTPYVYQGEELGMTGIHFETIEEYNDVETHNMYKERIEQGYAEEDIMHSIHVKGRDNSRTPMQWNESKHGGFTTGTPWLTVNPNYSSINAEQQVQDEHSIFNYYRQLIALRKAMPVIVYGTYTLLAPQDPTLYAFIREDEDTKLLVMANVSDHDYHVDLRDEVHNQPERVIISNYEQGEPSLVKTLRPYEAIVYQLAK